jgi:hypothetical protein
MSKRDTESRRTDTQARAGKLDGLAARAARGLPLFGPEEPEEATQDQRKAIAVDLEKEYAEGYRR